ncbi:uncharacterized protein LOC127094949 [Lathyrus oleraceus]|uniref:uncharacterized protein LOC127094949 n=1 Tax=Pisum sativum TaxID=3888 RepID=UPI0021D250E9|nr:uncharacterized protein LOC127094949 [Pisum sativum]
MDFIEKLPKSHGKDTIWVVIDRLSKYAHFIPIAHPFTVSKLAEIFIAEIYKLHGAPANIWYNTTYHSAIQATPYEIVYGQAPPLHLPYCPQSTKVEAVDRSFIVREEMIQKLQGNLVRAQARMKRQADKHRSDREFKEGDWVFLKLQPYRQASAQYRASEKLSPRFYGPYQVLHRVGKVTYTLILPSTSRIHPTFHVSLLKPCPDENIPVVALPEEWGSLDDPKEPFKILKRRSIQRHNRTVTEVLIQWKREAMEDATWELLYKLKLQFPYFDVTAAP